MNDFATFDCSFDDNLTAIMHKFTFENRLHTYSTRLQENI